MTKDTRPQQALIPLEEAWETVLKYGRPLGRARLSLHNALGMCLAEEIRADRDIPAADRSARDGFAVRSADFGTLPRRLRLDGEVAAGQPPAARVAPGSCVRILTGANMPPGADSVLMVEDSMQNNGDIVCRRSVEPFENILRQGEDARRGDVLLQKRTKLGPLHIGICAAVGKATVLVLQRPRVCVLCTGEELRDVDDAVSPHEIRDSNGPALCAALAQWGWDRVAHCHAPDSLPRLVGMLRRRAARYDVVLLTGGVSVGKYDLVPAAVERIGATVRFHRVAMKPGKPCLYATLPGNRHVFGLPGNPLSAMAGFHEFVLPLLRRLSGTCLYHCRPKLHLPLASAVRVKPSGRRQLLLAQLHASPEGLSAEFLSPRSSADLVTGAQADGVIVAPQGADHLAAGSVAAFRPWRPL